MLPYLGLGNIALHSGDIAEAEKWFIPAREMQPEHPAVLLAWGRLTRGQRQSHDRRGACKKERQEARRLLEKSKTKGEESATIIPELARVYFKLEMWDKAAENYEAACACGGAATICASRWAKPMRKLGRIGEAEQKFRQVLAFSPDDADAGASCSCWARPTEYSTSAFHHDGHGSTALTTDYEHEVRRISRK